MAAAAAAAAASSEVVIHADVHDAKEQGNFAQNYLDVSPESVITVDAHATKQLLSIGYKYLDVRTEEEFKKGHLKKALNVAYMLFTPQGREKNPEFVEQVSAIFGKDDHIVVGCHSGTRSLKAAADLIRAGFKYVKNMGGGYAAWVENGYGVKEEM